MGRPVWCRPALWLLLALPGCLCLAQGPGAELKPNPTAALVAFEPPVDQPYELGRGDEITVEVIGRPELLSRHVIGPDGKITLPIVGSILVADETRDQAARAIESALSSYYTGVAVSVGVDRYTSNKIVLLGAVEHPGVLTFDQTPTLLEVISRGGLGVPVPGAAAASGAGMAARPMVIPEECMVYRGNSTMITVELKRLLDEGNPLANMRLKRGDLVYVPGQNRFVSVLGQVSHPGNVRLDSASTLPQLLADAGGLTDQAGINPTIQIIHRQAGGTPGRTQKIAYKELLHPQSLDVTLQPGDIIFVPESGFNHFAYTFEKMSPAVNLITVGALLN